jgi:Zn finger protein HypA/HybF involved in hydrogenase expression
LWSAWKAKNPSVMSRRELESIIANIEAALSKAPAYTQVEITFGDVHCPTCSEWMVPNRATDQLMKCPKCGEIAGRYDGVDDDLFRCIDCDQLWALHRFEGVDVVCPKCQQRCVDFDPNELVTGKATTADGATDPPAKRS